MTIETWFKEIHGGKTIPEETPIEGMLEALDFAIETYSNLGEKMLKKHKIYWKRMRERDWWFLADEEEKYYYFNADNCWLCLIFNTEYESGNLCEGCPLEEMGKRCNDSEKVSPWEMLIYERDPKPLLEALKKAKNMMKELSR
jgi:hypothetical protein